MKRTATLLETLKKYLKAKGMTYKMLATEMQMSEAAIKRMFSKQAFSLSRLEEVCRVLDIDFYDLVLMDRQRNRETPDSLTTDQEKALLGNEKMSFLLYFLSNGWSVSQIIEEYDYTETEAIKMLGELEKIGLLEVHPRNRIRLLVHANVFWQVDGPLRKAYDQLFIDDFMDSNFKSSGERLVFSPGQFSRTSLKIIQKKIDNLVKEYNQLAEMDAALPIKGRYSTGIFIGFRPWVFTRIADLRRR